VQSNKYLYVVFLATSATMFGALMASSVKFLTTDLHPIIICFYRCLMGLIFITPWVIKNNFKALRSNNLKLQISRSVINVFSMICWFSAIGLMHFEKAAALGFSTPLFTTILAIILLKEKIRFHRTAALIIGFIGIIVIIRPGLVPFEIGAGLLLLSAFTFSFVLIIVKKLSSIDESQTIIFYHLLFSTPIFFILSLFYWQDINLNQLLIFAFMGATGLLSPLVLSSSF
jgi:EamA-like transporter family.